MGQLSTRFCPHALPEELMVCLSHREQRAAGEYKKKTGVQGLVNNIA